MAFRREKSGVFGVTKLLVISILCWSLTITSVAGDTAVKGGYYTGGTSGLFSSQGLDSSLFTHLFYAFAGMNGQTSAVFANPADVEEMKTFSSATKIKNPNVLTLISVSVSGAQFGPVLQSSASQQAFITSSIALARNYSFDGIDLDWEFAQSQQEMDQFGTFIAQWRQAVIAEGKQTSRPALLLTAAVYFNVTLIYTGNGTYPIDAIAQNLDFVNIMAYDYHGDWDVTETGANTNLFDPSSDVNTDYGIRMWLAAGLPPEKAVLGLTLYGRSWVLKDQNTASGLGAPAIAAGPPQSVSKENGTFFYSEVVSFIKANGATVVHNMSEVTGYCFANNVWVSYEDPLIISTKVRYVKSKELRGYFFWEVSQDNNFEVSRAASQALDSGASFGPSQAPSSGGQSTGSSSVFVVAVVMVISVLLLLRWSTVDIVR